MIRHLISISLFFCLTQATMGLEKLDSLKRTLQSATVDTSKIDIYILLAEEIREQDRNASIEYLENGITLAKQISSKRRLLKCYDQLCINYRLGLQYIKLPSIQKKMADLASDLGEWGMCSKYLGDVGYNYMLLSDFPAAIEYHMKSLRIAEEHELRMGIAASNINIGMVYYRLEDYNRSLEYYESALQNYLAVDSKPGVAGALLWIANIRAANNENILAIEKYQECLQMFQRLGRELEVGICYCNIGLVLSDQGKMREAHEYQLRGLAIYRQLNENQYVLGALHDVSESYLVLNQPDSALKYITEGIDLARKFENKDGEAIALKIRAAIYAEQEQWEKSFTDYKQHRVLVDIMFNEGKSKDIGKLEAKHEFETAEIERKRLEIEELRLQNEQKSRRDNLQYSGILIFLVLVFAGVFMLGRVSIPIRLAEGMIFFAFLLFFEFTLVLLDPYIEEYSSGAPAIKLAFNAVLAGLIFPLHSFFEERLKGRIVK